MGPPLKVAHLIYGLQIGGLEHLVAELSSRSRDKGVDPLLIAFGVDGPMREVITKRNLPLKWLGDVKGLSLPMLKQLAEIFYSFKPDVAHAHDLGPWLNVVAAKAARPWTKVVATFHQLAPPRGSKAKAAAVAARWSDAIVACGDEVRRDIESWAPRGANVVTIGNGVSLFGPTDPSRRAQARARLGLPSEATVVGYLGRMHEEKGPDLLVDAFLARYASSPSVHLVLIGTGPLLPALKHRIDQAGVTNVHLIGEVVDRANELLFGLDIYAQTSRREGRSLSMLEAMAAGLPTVSHDLPAIAEIHRADQTALLVRVGDADSLAAALVRLVEDPSLRERMGRSAIERAELYSSDAMVDRYVSLYRSCLGQA